MFGRLFFAIRSLMIASNSSSGNFADADRQVQPSFDTGLHQQLGVRERDVVRGHRQVRLVRLLDDRQINSAASASSTRPSRSSTQILMNSGFIFA